MVNKFLIDLVCLLITINISYLIFTVMMFQKYKNAILDLAVELDMLKNELGEK